MRLFRSLPTGEAVGRDRVRMVRLNRSLRRLVGLSHSGLGVYALEEQERDRGAQKRSRDAEQSPANRAGSTSPSRRATRKPFEW